MKPLIAYLPYGAWGEIRHLYHSDNAEALFAIVKFDIGKFFERHIAVFIFAESDHYAVKDCIVSLFAPSSTNQQIFPIVNIATHTAFLSLPSCEYRG